MGVSVSLDVAASGVREPLRGGGSCREVPPGALGGPRVVAALLAESPRAELCSPGNVKKLGETYPKISNAQNAELRLRWGQIVLKNDHQEDFWKVKEFLCSQVGDPPPPPHLDGQQWSCGLWGGEGEEGVKDLGLL